ncbi:uncharacterized protein F5891DRAFT_654463 [Suillus fuscotomentosus]|uniref:Uncharacterized protein n=1 Tax=Suillus fuscotomentosus TaxID=1912939 RepID=A0AAD4DX53_9AGAM|nr:uncharacterized protein F5891DRAFT_654463 [Suillus fuscotomentosus]KAG1895612.1 hypothetical protein F5891DRAFT_654463 [Suillus fuscotomentosus]
MHSNFFYKNVIWTLAMFWFMPFSSTQPIYMITALFCFKVLTTMTQMLSSWSPRPLYRIPTTWKIVSRPVPLTTRHLTSLRPRPYHPRSTSIHQEK